MEMNAGKEREQMQKGKDTHTNTRKKHARMSNSIQSIGMCIMD